MMNKKLTKISEYIIRMTIFFILSLTFISTLALPFVFVWLMIKIINLL
jgi:hypothetical protein